MENTRKVGVIAGTRPEIIKMAPIIRALQKHKIPMFFVHCGQHYDYNMSKQFIENLELPFPDYSFKIKSYSAWRTDGKNNAANGQIVERNCTLYCIS